MADVSLEIAHVLFIDIVGYSKLSLNQQHAAIEELNEIARASEQFRKSEAEGQLLKLATGDGMALVFPSSPQAPAQCAVEIARALKTRPHLSVRMGIHSGPVNGIVDLAGNPNVAGAGINVAQRVMNCGDAGHVLLSKRAAEDLREFERWRPRLHEIGAAEVKHGTRIELVNLHDDEIGNPSVPAKMRALQRQWWQRRATIAASALIALAIVLVIVIRRTRNAAAAGNVPEKSIAVLPFENLSPDPDNAYFATGIQDEILTRLAKIGALKVISHTSTQQYSARPGNLPEIARQLGVANILEGSVQRAADQVHINVQLIRASTDQHLWAESYDRKLENIFGIEGEVATAVADSLRAKLTGDEQKTLEEKPTNNPEAYDAYLRGIAVYRLPSVGRYTAMQSFEEAVRLDPNFALAWALLIRAQSLAYPSDPTTAGRAAVQQSLETALRLQPDLPEVQLAHAFYQLWVLRDYEGARRSFESLRQKLPNNPDIPEALYLISVNQGRWEEARVHTEDSIALGPRDRLLRLEAAYVCGAARDFSAAMKYYDEALNIWPDDPALLADKADLCQSLGDLDQADALLKKVHLTAENLNGLGVIGHQAALRRQPGSAIPLLHSWLDRVNSLPARTRLGYRFSLGDLQRLAGDTDSANYNYSRVRDELEPLLQEAPEYADWICEALAEAYAGLGDWEDALRFADRAIRVTPSPSLALRYEEIRARIEARFGMKALAIPTLERLLRTTYGYPLTPALLRLDPDFDLLRGDPRFEKLAHSDGK